MNIKKVETHLTRNELIKRRRRSNKLDTLPAFDPFASKILPSFDNGVVGHFDFSLGLKKT